MYNGLLVLDKPHGVTSRAALDRAMHWFPPRTKLGHTGTLDPLATGVLVLCVGQATRLTELVQEMPKIYVSEITLGARSATDDAEGPITPVEIASPPTQAAVEATLPSFLGTIDQVPPAFSAVKLAGRRSYDLARQGRPADLAARSVRIDHIYILAFEYPTLRIEVACRKGTYIRSLARDLGERLGCGGYVSALRRTRVGPFVPEQSVPLDADASTAHAKLLPMAEAAIRLPYLVLDDAQRSRFTSGQAVPVDTPTGVEHGADATCAVFDSAGQFIGIGRADGDGGLIRPVKVFVR